MGEDGLVRLVHGGWSGMAHWSAVGRHLQASYLSGSGGRILERSFLFSQSILQQIRQLVMHAFIFIHIRLLILTKRK